MTRPSTSFLAIDRQDVDAATSAGMTKRIDARVKPAHDAS
jgi:hypothetical protein